MRWPWNTLLDELKALNGRLDAADDHREHIYDAQKARLERIEAKQQAMHEALKQLVTAQWETKRLVEKQPLPEEEVKKVQAMFADVAQTHASVNKLLDSNNCLKAEVLENRRLINGWCGALDDELLRMQHKLKAKKQKATTRRRKKT